jgi:hypothetical protein
MSEYRPLSVGQKIKAITGTEFKEEMTISKITSEQVWVKAKDGKELGPFDRPLKKNAMTESKQDKLKRGNERYGTKMNGKKYTIPTGNAQLVYGIRGVAGETFTVDRQGTMVPPGHYRVVSKGSDHHSGAWGTFSELEVEAIDSGTKQNEKFEKGEQFFIKGSGGPKGKTTTAKGYKVKYAEQDEYPIGTPGWWVEVIE